MSENKVLNSYSDGCCPDCNNLIPFDVVEGQACKCCGHTFMENVPSNDQKPQKLFDLRLTEEQLAIVYNAIMAQNKRRSETKDLPQHIDQVTPSIEEDEEYIALAFDIAGALHVSQDMVPSEMDPTFVIYASERHPG